MTEPKPYEIRRPTADAGSSGNGRRRAVAIAGVAAALLAGAVVLAWFTLRGVDSNPSTPTTTVARTGPIILSAAGLGTIARATSDPIYWAGPAPKTFYELTRTTSANVYVRYLPPGVNAGAPKGNYLIVATYPFKNAYAALRRTGAGKEVDVPGGGIALVQSGYPVSVHLAWPGVNYQIEVYDPRPEKALAVALSGKVKPVG